MSEQNSKAASVGSILAALLAAGLGRFLGWAFGLRFVLPIVAGLVVLAMMKKKLAPAMQALAPALAVHAALLTWGLLEFALNSMQYGLHISPIYIVLMLVSIGGLVWAMSQPGIGPVGLLLVRDGYTLLMTLPSLNVFTHGSAIGAVNAMISVGITLLLAGAAVYFLAMAAKALQATPA